MESSDELPAIVVPGPELRERVDHFASRLSTLEKRKADEMVAKVLASPKRNQFLFVDASHIFYPYFLSKVSEFRQHPERRPDANKKDAAVPSASAAPLTVGGQGTTTTTKADGVVRTVGGTLAPRSDSKREALLREAEQEAKRYLEDPYPNHYSLDLKGGTVDIPAVVMDILSVTAQYTAKYGEAFLISVQTKRKRDPLFRFLEADDVRHGVFTKLVDSYKRILHFDPDATETRLDNMQRPNYVLETVCAEKMRYAQATVARRKAALLTDDELKAKLQWQVFKVVKNFTLTDVLLDGPVPETAASRRQLHHYSTAHPPVPAPSAEAEDPTAALPAATVRSSTNNMLQPPGGAYVPVYLGSSLVPDGTSDRRKIVVEEQYTPQAVAPVRRGVEYFVDDRTGERLRVAEMQPSRGDGSGPAVVKRSREEMGLSSEDDMARELQRQAKERPTM